MFKKFGFGMIGASALTAPLAWMDGGVSILTPLFLSGVTAAYWKIGLTDLKQDDQALRRNFPVLIHVRYILEMIRPEVRQYLVEGDEMAEPYSREMRTLIYQRAKGEDDTRALGTKRNVYAEGFAPCSAQRRTLWAACDSRATRGSPWLT